VKKKYKESISVNPHVIVTITGNSIREIINPTGGINRRIIYFPSDFLPQTKDFNLFFFNAFGLAKGKIIPCLPGFINWILSCPQPFIESLGAGGEVLTKFINPDNFISSHHLDAWIESTLTKDEKGKLQVGNSKSGKDTLYGNYLNWCSLSNIEPPIKINRFSELLLDSFKTLSTLQLIYAPVNNFGILVDKSKGSDKVRNKGKRNC